MIMLQAARCVFVYHFILWCYFIWSLQYKDCTFIHLRPNGSTPSEDVSTSDLMVPHQSLRGTSENAESQSTASCCSPERAVDGGEQRGRPRASPPVHGAPEAAWCRQPPRPGLRSRLPVPRPGGGGGGSIPVAPRAALAGPLVARHGKHERARERTPAARLCCGDVSGSRSAWSSP